MGCQTGLYLLVRDADNAETLAVVKSVLAKIIAHEGPVPGATRVECGNYKNLELGSAKTEARRYLDALNSRVCDFKYAEG
jgi:S-ribosylhomocysteine lyase